MIERGGIDGFGVHGCLLDERRIRESEERRCSLEYCVGEENNEHAEKPRDSVTYLTQNESAFADSTSTIRDIFNLEKEPRLLTVSSFICDGSDRKSMEIVRNWGDQLQ